LGIRTEHEAPSPLVVRPRPPFNTRDTFGRAKRPRRHPPNWTPWEQAANPVRGFRLANALDGKGEIATSVPLRGRKKRVAVTGLAGRRTLQRSTSQPSRPAFHNTNTPGPFLLFIPVLRLSYREAIILSARSRVAQ